MSERESDRIRVLVADDHRMARAGLCLLLRLEPDLEIVGEANDGYEALTMTMELRPDVLVADISMPGPGGVELARRLANDLPSVRVVVLTLHEDANLAREAQAAGAAGYIVKRAAESELIAAIRATARSEFYMDRGIGSLHDGDTPTRARPAGGDPATNDAETRLLTLLAQGLSMSQVAQAMSIDVSAAEDMREAVTARLALRSRIDIMRYARAHGLLESRAE